MPSGNQLSPYHSLQSLVSHLCRSAKRDVPDIVRMLLLWEALFVYDTRRSPKSLAPLLRALVREVRILVVGRESVTRLCRRVLSL